MRKFFLGSLIFFALITLMEIAYYFFILNSQPNISQTEFESLRPQVSSTLENVQEFGINPESAKELTKLYQKPKDLLIGSVVINTYRGKIKRLETKEGKIGNFTYVFLLSIADPNGTEFGQVFSKDEVDNKLSIIKTENGIEKRISLQELRKGQLVEWEHKVDLTKELNLSLISAKITILD